MLGAFQQKLSSGKCPIATAGALYTFITKVTSKYAEQQGYPVGSLACSAASIYAEARRMESRSLHGVIGPLYSDGWHIQEDDSRGKPVKDSNHELLILTIRELGFPPLPDFDIVRKQGQKGILLLSQGLDDIRRYSITLDNVLTWMTPDESCEPQQDGTGSISRIGIAT
ncbi:hypothetical protein [Nevskia soli]|uniref:hypothetical protein n=1 Tax=Nevskia soli TaxID=418856 RepID=UPI0012FCFADB|nr:hypothetical protein [Nevskia soli]